MVAQHYQTTNIISFNAKGTRDEISQLKLEF